MSDAKPMSTERLAEIEDDFWVMNYDARRRVMRELLDSARLQAARIAELESRLGRAVTIADETFGPFPVLSDDEALTKIEQGVFAQRQRIAALERDLAAMADQLEAAQREVERLTGHLGSRSEHSRLLAKSQMVDRAAIADLTAERDALRAEVERMRPVVEAADAWRGNQIFTLKTPLTDAVDAYRTAKGRTP